MLLSGDMAGGIDHKLWLTVVITNKRRWIHQRRKRRRRRRRRSSSSSSSSSSGGGSRPTSTPKVHSVRQGSQQSAIKRMSKKLQSVCISITITAAKITCCSKGQMGQRFGVLSAPNKLMRLKDTTAFAKRSSNALSRRTKLA